MLQCGIAAQALRMPKRGLLKGECYVSVSAAWSLVGKQLFAACGILFLIVC